MYKARCWKCPWLSSHTNLFFVVNPISLRVAMHRTKWIWSLTDQFLQRNYWFCLVQLVVYHGDWGEQFISTRDHGWFVWYILLGIRFDLLFYRIKSYEAMWSFNRVYFSIFLCSCKYFKPMLIQTKTNMHTNKIYTNVSIYSGLTVCPLVIKWRAGLLGNFRSRRSESQEVWS